MTCLRAGIRNVTGTKKLEKENFHLNVMGNMNEMAELFQNEHVILIMLNQLKNVLFPHSSVI